MCAMRANAYTTPPLHLSSASHRRGQTQPLATTPPAVNGHANTNGHYRPTISTNVPSSYDRATTRSPLRANSYASRARLSHSTTPPMYRTASRARLSHSTTPPMYRSAPPANTHAHSVPSQQLLHGKMRTPDRTLPLREEDHDHDDDDDEEIVDSPTYESPTEGSGSVIGIHDRDRDRDQRDRGSNHSGSVNERGHQSHRSSGSGGSGGWSVGDRDRDRDRDSNKSYTHDSGKVYTPPSVTVPEYGTAPTAEDDESPDVSPGNTSFGGGGGVSSGGEGIAYGGLAHADDSVVDDSDMEGLGTGGSSHYSTPLSSSGQGTIALLPHPGSGAGSQSHTQQRVPQQGQYSQPQQYPSQQSHGSQQQYSQPQQSPHGSQQRPPMQQYPSQGHVPVNRSAPQQQQQQQQPYQSPPQPQRQTTRSNLAELKNSLHHLQEPHEVEVRPCSLISFLY